MFCSFCGAEYQDNDAFCPECGAPNLVKAAQTSGNIGAQYYQPPQYIVYSSPFPAPAPRNIGAAITGLVFGIIGFCTSYIPYLGAFLGLIGLVLSIGGLADRNGGAKGAATTGLIFSIFAVIIGIVVSVSCTSCIKSL